MDLEEVLSKNGLEQDEWSLTRPKFGEHGQLEVVGWSGRNQVSNKYYILKCSICCKDPELFGEGYFKTFKNNLNTQTIPCGCSKRHHWSENQYVVKCSRRAEELGYTFLGFQGDSVRYHTRYTRLACKEHGEWCSVTVNHLLGSNKRARCPGCRVSARGEGHSKSDEANIAEFLASGAFHPETKFWRSERKTRQGCKSYWYLYCPECETQGEAFVGSLVKGHLSCGCSTWQQTEAYINLVMEEDLPIAIKFGIANKSTRRVKVQNRFSCYTVSNYLIYKFPDTDSCRNAERQCKKELETGVILKRDMPDGYSETTWFYNLDRVIKIYENNGGLKLDS